MEKVRVGILGAGGIAKKHAAALDKIETARLVAVCDINADAAAAMAGGRNAQVYTDYRRMIGEEHLDALYLCLPPFAHDGQAELAASRGIALFCEKPLALTVERARSIVTAAESRGVVNQIGYHNRFGGAVSKMKTLIDTGKAGRVTLFDGRFSCNALHAPWWREKNKSGGQILEQVIHTYDAAMYFMGDAEVVIGQIANLCHGDVERYTVEDTSAAVLCFKSGALASITASNCSVPQQWISTFSLICEKITAHFSDPNNAEFIYHYELDEAGLPRSEKIESAVDMILAEDRAFIEAVRSGENKAAPLREGLRSLEIVDAVTRSSASGAPVVL